jgi:hypothetical protein
LFHPRQHNWTEHFNLGGVQVVGRTAIGRTTAALLQMNAPDRIELRLQLMAAGLWH